ncbi:hypothetical protein N7451_001198 [Penicillium sp. IBT 35674x]|nr:hypothetical protein N7451_001198 [Penicillium sp. IBT 35674x]
MLGLWQSTMSALALVVLLSTPAVLGLRVTSGSSCTDSCNKWGAATNTTADEISCVDTAFNSTTKGKDFKDCITCELESTYEDDTTGETDVNWGLYNLRFALSTCVFGYPESISNVSSPCPVACGTVQDAVQFELEDPNADNLGAWCDTASFADNVINTCEFCYNLTTNQIYLANFLESIRYNCHFPTTSGDEFAVSPTRIFSESLLPSSMSLTTPSASSSHVNLGLVIALPVLAFIIICLGIGTCCFFYIRYRRKRNRQNRFPDHLYARYNDTTISTPMQGQGDWTQQQQQMYSDYQAFAQMHAAGYGQHHGFNEQYGQAHEMYGLKPKQDIQPQATEITVPGPYPGLEQAPHAIGTDQKHAM